MSTILCYLDFLFAQILSVGFDGLYSMVGHSGHARKTNRSYHHSEYKTNNEFGHINLSFLALRHLSAFSILDDYARLVLFELAWRQCFDQPPCDRNVLPTQYLA